MTDKRDILVVDDEPVIAQGVSKVCSAEGMSVDVAESGAAGLKMLSEGRYTIVICDIMMPQMDGFQFLAEVARRKLRTLVVMATGYSTVENAVRSLSCGAVDFIPKPFTADELLSVLRRDLKFSRLQEPVVPSTPGGIPGFPSHIPPPPEYHRLGYAGWALVEAAGTVLLGVSDLFLKTIGEIRKIDLLPPGGETAQGNGCAAITAADGLVHSLMCPVSGRIIEANLKAASGPAIVEKDPYFAGWLYRVLPSDLERDLRRLGARGPGPV